MNTTDTGSARRFSLQRWSQRKLAAARAARAPQEDGRPVEGTGTAPEVSPPQFAGIATVPGASAAVTQPTATPSADAVLPAVESLDLSSDFRPFLNPGVDEGLRRQALRKLFHDPHFNVMDGLDVYVDDYSKPDPIPAAVLARLAHAQGLLDPPAPVRPVCESDGAQPLVDESTPVDATHAPQPTHANHATQACAPRDAGTVDGNPVEMTVADASGADRT